MQLGLAYNIEFHYCDTSHARNKLIESFGDELLIGESYRNVS